ncbi:MAG TPA: hypothetical protein VFM54_17100 [Micromonosporaceae bacterium]|nr:hypothetical protein [Micromonosporaceae bacterium]
MSRWWVWDRQLAPGSLAHYVHTGVVTGLLSDPPPRAMGRSVGAEDRLRALYHAFRVQGVCYADEPYTASPGGQVVRPPDQVLKLPRHGNCLDLSVTFAGACLDAGLHPLIVVLDNARGEQPSHALVVVWLAGDWTGPGGRAAGGTYPLHQPILQEPPRWRGGLRAAADAAGAFVAVDVAGVATTWAPNVTVRHGATFEQAVQRAAGMLADGAGWAWGVGVDVGLVYGTVPTSPLPNTPSAPPLTPAYHAEDQVSASPLSQVRARNRVVPFEDRQEMELLHQWLTAPGPLTRVAVLHGVGGAGKTRLAAQFAHSLTDDGWYTGFLPRYVPDGDMQWLGALPSPVLIVLDYVEAAGEANLLALFRTLRSRTAPTAVLCTARVELSWWTELGKKLTNDGWAPAEPTRIPLTRRHPRSRSLYERAYRRFAASRLPGSPPDIGYQWPWTTTLDLVMLAWVAAGGVQPLPTTKADLYNEVIDRELSHWSNTISERDRQRVDLDALRQVAACVSLLTPRPDHLAATITAAGIGDASTLTPRQLANTLNMLLREDRDGVAEVAAVRPDPIADHLITTVLGSEPPLFDRCLSLLRPPDKEPDEPAGEARDSARISLVSDMTRCCENLTRAAATDRDVADRLAARMLTRLPELGVAALAVALVHGGPLVRPLEELARLPDTPLPLRSIEPRIPFGHGELRQLALIAAERLYTGDVASDGKQEDLARVAAELGQLAVRRAEAAQHSRAVDAGRAATSIYRRLAGTNPAAFTPDLAGSLNNLANLLSDAGAREEALTAIQEAVTHYKKLTAKEPALFVNRLIGSLSRQADLHPTLGQAMEQWAAVSADLPHGPRAEVVLARAEWRRSRGDGPAGDTDLLEAVAAADAEQDPARAARARLAVRAALADCPTPPGAPEWAATPIPEDLLSAIGDLRGAGERSARHAAIRRLHQVCADPDARAALTALADLRPDLDLVTFAATLLNTANEVGVDTLIADLDRQQDLAALVAEWLATANWAESYRFLRSHPALTSNPGVVEHLMRTGADDRSRRHTSILLLARVFPLQQIYDAILDPTDAADLLLTAVASADADTVRLLWQLTEHISRDPALSPLAAALVTLYSDGDGQLATALQLAAAAGQAANHRIRRDAERQLRNRAQHDPNRAETLGSLADAVAGRTNTDAAG